MKKLLAFCAALAFVFGLTVPAQAGTDVMTFDEYSPGPIDDLYDFSWC